MDQEQAKRLREFVSVFRPAWGSDHLSFNAFADGDGWPAAGFFLPPRQCAESVAVAAAKIHALRGDLGIPIAFETGETVRLGARLVPPERAMVETDTPYLAPPPHRGEPNEPAWVALNGRALAGVWGIDVADVERITTENAARVFK